jgi:MoaA/NifB/PqqE/SkfB family radical SAM enzyme
MFNYTDLKSVHLEVTSKCQARCPMCPRRINGGMLNPMITLDEISLEKFKTWFDIDFIKQLNDFNLCGNLGDPIIAQDTLEIFKYLRKHNPNLILIMHTNGSARNNVWWQALAKVNVRVTFGIDGLEDTHALYRIGTDFDKIIDNAYDFIQAGGTAEWHMLVFKHNEHQIEECRRLSEELGFKKFTTKHTSRFTNNQLPVLDEQGKTTHVLYPTAKSVDMISKIKSAVIEIKPVITCKSVKNKQIYISADGNVSPCCWTDFSWILHKQDNRIDYMDKIGVIPNLNTMSLKDVFDSGFFNKIANTWDNNPLMECSKQCGSFDKLNEQFE